MNEPIYYSLLLATFPCDACGGHVRLVVNPQGIRVVHPRPSCILFQSLEANDYIGRHADVMGNLALEQLEQLEQQTAQALESHGRYSRVLSLLLCLYLACGAIAIARADLVPMLTWCSMVVALVALVLSLQPYPKRERH